MFGRTWIFLLVGAITIGFASFMFAMTRDPDGWNGLTMTELAVMSILVGGSVGTVVGLLTARVTSPAGGRRLWLTTLLAVLGAAVGIVLTLASGSVCSDGVLPMDSFCGLNFLVWNLSSGVAIALSAALGAIVGAFLGFVVSVTFLRRARAVQARRTIRSMNARARWTVVGVMLLVVLGVVALYLFNTNLTMTRNLQRDEGPRTWIIEPGETLTLSADEVLPNDRYRCTGHPAINFTPHEGTGYREEGGLSVSTAEDGTVTVYCDDPGNV